MTESISLKNITYFTFKDTALFVHITQEALPFEILEILKEKVFELQEFLNAQ